MAKRRIDRFLFETLAIPDDFLASLSHKPLEAAGCMKNRAIFPACCDLNAMTRQITLGFP